ncbi:MAG: M3 family peptidase [Kiritimatiellae bacterium]|nr:M3 family peptidase [Kiritimatiellia bacterium]
MTADAIDWAALTPESAAGRLPLLLEEAERGVAALEKEAPGGYEALFWGLDDATRGLWREWGAISHMLHVMNSPGWRELDEKFRPQIVAFSQRVAQSRILYEASKKALASEKDPVRRRIMSESVKGAELSGVGLDGEKKTEFNTVQKRLAQLGMEYANAVIDATGEEISDAVYPEKMKHCPDEKERERLYRLRVSRAPENAVRVVETLALRRRLAEILGYENYAALSLSRKCAGSAGAVMKMIDDLDLATEAKAAAEDAELGENPAPWNRAYLAERIREKRYCYSEEELKRHFELESVLEGLFRIADFLFGVEIVERTASAGPAWHGDVRYFSVLEKGEEIAGFYFDPYVRPGLKSGGAWMNEFENRCDRRGTKPLAAIVTNFPEPDEEGRCFLPLREVETLFHEFGHALQCMLTKVGEEAAAGINLVEWDAVEVASQFMENWCLDDRTGISIPEELKKKVRSAKNFREASACRRQLAFSRLDLKLHLGEAGDPNALKECEFGHFGLACIPEDGFLNAFTHVFAGGYAAGYYGYKWAEVMSADCYGAFEERMAEGDDALREEGRRFRDTVLALGGSKSAIETFREFRGRDPEIGALLRQRDLA